MHKKILIIIAFVISFSSLLKAEINQIIIEGNNRVSDETVKVYSGVKLDKELNEKELNKILINLYQTNFFEDVKVTLDNNILNISLKEYPIINQLVLVGEPNNKISDQIKKFISLKEKNSFIKSNIKKDIEIIKKFYANLGYNFADIEAKAKEIDIDNFDLIFEINRGKKTKISSITFIGDKKIKSKRLKDIIASEEDKFWKILSRNTKFSESLLNLDIRLLTNYYKSLGYYDVKITSNSAEINESGNIDLIFSIFSGERYIINKISTNVDPSLKKNIFYDLEKEFKKYIGDYYSPFKVKKLLDKIDELIDINNIQFIEHNVQEVIENDNISIVFNIFEGEKTLVERINISGNSVTKEEVIRSGIILDEGDPFTQTGLEKSISNIKAKNIFGNVSSNVLDGSEDNLKIIDINVEERPTGEISAGAGVGTNGGSLAFQVSENNWLGEGKKVNFSLESDKETFKGNIRYLDPNYNFLGNSIGYTIFSTSNDRPNQGYENTLIGAGVDTKFEQYDDIFVSLGLSASFDDLRTDGSASDSLKKQSGDFSEIAASYGFSMDKRNRTFMPTSGGILGLSQTLPIYADKSYISNILTFSQYKSFTENVVISNKFFLSTIDGLNDDDVRLSKRKTLSSKRLRGFKKGKVGPKDGKDHVGGNYAAAYNVDMNLPQLLPDSTNIDVGLFLDFGNIWGVDYDSSIDDSNKIRSSTGIVANYSSPIGPLSFIISSDISKASTDQTESFNFNLGTTF